MKKSSKKLNFSSSDYVYMLAGIVFFTGLAIIIWLSWQKLFSKDSTSGFGDAKIGATTVPAECDKRRTLDGVCIDENHPDSQKLVAVMIENHFEARPQAGLSKASIVYEAPVEANITRFLAIYDSAVEVKKVGPVRSARPYYLDWLAEYGTPMYMHVGGSPDAVTKIDAYGVFDLDEFYRGWYFWRSSDRFAPHNTYTSSVLWQKALDAYESLYSSSTYEGWKFAARPLLTTRPHPTPPLIGEGGVEQASAADGGSAVSVITITFAGPTYQPVWKYSSTTGQYERYQMGLPHRDDDGSSIFASTVIVQRVNVQVLDAVGRRAITTIGSGEAQIFKNGTVTVGTWKKESRTARTKWYNVDGQEIELVPGKIWIEVLGQDGTVKIK